MKHYPSVLTIAGSDSSGGAGIQADIKSISANGGYAASVITAITAQNTQGVQAVTPLEASLVSKQLESVCEDIAFDAVKIGVFVTKENLEVIVQAIHKYALKNIIVDPVMIAQSGDMLINLNIIDSMQKKLFPLATLLTPNIPETEYLLSAIPGSANVIPDSANVIPDSIRDPIKKASAINLSKKYNCNILLKGGHEKSQQCEDILYIQSKNEFHHFNSPRIKTKNTHGTGCSLSSTIATYVARGFSLEIAVQHAHEYIFQAIKHGAEYQIGKGNGPICHFYKQSKVLDDISTVKD
ncbi:MAG: bifunctional hydroxymethylpyrimidine kinase/phosphomethylpyrimidine kinase [Coxiellaceae bacterium]|nr:bifunctional hydroxymethylpyrimidine kinase/phosphomethylpyrimidine kinase [Coxiellaceae bacterium]